MQPNLTKFFAHVSCGRVSVGVVICYVLLVLWMISCFYIIGAMGRNLVICYGSVFAHLWHILV